MAPATGGGGQKQEIGVGLETLGKLLLVVGGVTALLGLALLKEGLLGGRIPFVGRLPGDILIQRDNLTIYIPLVTMLLFSVVLTIVLNVVFRFWGR